MCDVGYFRGPAKCYAISPKIQRELSGMAKLTRSLGPGAIQFRSVLGITVLIHAALHLEPFFRHFLFPGSCLHRGIAGMHSPTSYARGDSFRISYLMADHAASRAD
jgi:hypothetical protein